MDDGALLTIGELARLTGLPVKTIRFWSDTGVLPPTDRTPAGYRLYGHEAQLRLGLVRTLRDLGIDLTTVQQVLEREVDVADIAAVHAEALQVQIRTLRMRQAVLHTVARRGASPEELERMHNLARLTDEERRRLIDDFVDDAFEGTGVDAGFLEMMRGAMPELPESPTPQQVDAWVELAELAADQDFRAGVRRAAADQARERDVGWQSDPAAAQRIATLLRERTDGAREAGVAPDSAAARPVVDELVAAYAQLAGRADSPEFRTWLLERLETGYEPRYERYWQLLALINGGPVPPSQARAVAWLTAALRAH